VYASQRLLASRATLCTTRALFSPPHGTVSMTTLRAITLSLVAMPTTFVYLLMVSL
jgi:hypothetical protein